MSKSSGEVEISTAEAQPASLTAGTSVPVGATIRTGTNGRVLLTRGEESMLVSPNSIVGIPKEKSEGMATTIVQQAGSVLLKVEKRDVKHFEVETPYLAAVVKGTEFRVTVAAAASYVDVLAGKVEVSDFKSGQFALLSPGQTATASQGAGGLSLSGSGSFAPIQQGTPRRPPAQLLPAADQRPAPEPRANPQGIRVASVPVVSEPALPAASAAKQTGWLTGLFGWGQSGAARHAGRNDDLALMLAVPGGIGVVVAIASAFGRRRRKERNGGAPNH